MFFGGGLKRFLLGGEGLDKAVLGRVDDFAPERPFLGTGRGQQGGEFGKFTLFRQIAVFDLVQPGKVGGRVQCRLGFGAQRRMSCAKMSNLRVRNTAKTSHGRC